MSIAQTQSAPRLTPLLEWFQTRPITPGSNRAEHLVNAAWRMMVDSMDLRRVLHVGEPVRQWLQALPQDVSVSVATDASSLHHVLADGACFDAIFVGDARLANRLLTEAAMWSLLQASLRANGAMFADGKLRNESILQSALAKSEFWVTPRSGSLRTAFPFDADVAGFVLRSVLHGNSTRNRLFSAAGRCLNRVGWLPVAARRRVQLFRKSKLPASAVPSYIAAAAAQAGIDCTGMRCGMSARGRFDSNKTIFYLFERDSRQPAIVVKISRAPEFNARLEHEYATLGRLHRAELLPQHALPKPLFLGSHAGLALSGQAAVAGTPLRALKHAAQPGAIQKMLDLLLRLAARSQHGAEASAAERALVLEDMVEQCGRTYGMSAPERKVLDRMTARIASSGSGLPLVLQHGDAGAWNVTVTPQREVVLMDWENAERHGLPLWDLLHFLVTLERARSKAGAADLFVNPQNRLRPLVMQALGRALRAVRIPNELLEPLFYLCWAYRAVRESWYLPAGRRDNGEYIRLLHTSLRCEGAVSTLLMEAYHTRVLPAA